LNTDSPQVTGLLQSLQRENQDAIAELVPLLYAELRRLASSYLRRERSDHTLQPTALVHEAYLRLVGQNVRWKNRSHFFGVASQLMRRILVDYARSHRAAKRGGTLGKISFEDNIVVSKETVGNLVVIDELLDRLAALDPLQGRIIEMRFFGGLTVKQTAEALDISAATVKREWSVAKAWLSREMQRSSSSEGPTVGEDKGTV
jgi:RNA polymerase sigma-70 factor (ECF subfamily)